MLQAVIIYLALVGFETGRAEQIMLQSFIYTKYTNLGDVQKSFQFLEKPRRRRQPQGTKFPKGLMRRTLVLLVRFESVMHLQCLPSSAKQQREMTKWYVIWKK